MIPSNGRQFWGAVALLCTLAAGACEQETAAVVPDVQTAPPSEAELLAGTWVRTHKAGRAEYEFRGDGSYVQSIYGTKDTPDSTTEGSFSVATGTMTLATELSTETSPYVRDEGTFSRERVFLRTSGGGSGPEGTWEMTRERRRFDAMVGEQTLDEKVYEKLVLDGKGTTHWNREVSGPGGIQEQDDRDGTFTVDGDGVTVQDDMDVISYKVTGDKLYDTSGSWLYTRN